MRKKIAAGNWKMNGRKLSLSEVYAMAGAEIENCEVIICPPATLIPDLLVSVQGSNLQIGGQNCHHEAEGAYTGEISANMLRDIGVTHVILGHSERREYFGESDELIAQKITRAHEQGLVAILCIGETLAEREAGQAIDIVTSQLINSLPKSANAENTIIAYEPVWAIGTGKVPSNADIEEMHAAIRAHIPHDSEAMRVLYGGSVKPTNAMEIFALNNVDGGLVGGASLKAEDFLPIIAAAEQLSQE